MTEPYHPLPYHPLIGALSPHIVYPDDNPRDAYVPREILIRTRDAIAERHVNEPQLCVHLVYAFIRCHERGLLTLGRQLLQLAKVGLSLNGIEEVIHARHIGVDQPHGTVSLPPPTMRGVALQPRNSGN